MPSFVYHPRYELKWGGHVFPVEKYRLLHDRLVAEGLVGPEDFVEPQGVTDDELLLVHNRAYLQRLDDLADKPLQACLEFEAPINREVAAAVRFATGGTILACECAVADHTAAGDRGGRLAVSASETGCGLPQAALNLGGGFHHAFPDRGEGFCFINDVAVAIRSLQARSIARRFAVIDCDLHQGNGTAFIFRSEPDVYTFSIHQENLYPVPKQRSTLDVGLADGAGDDAYLAEIERHVPRILDGHRPDLVLYLAGADPFEEDQLGDLRLTKDGLRRRDELVLGAARARGLPVAVVLAGGYARRTEDVVDIHFATCQVIRELWG